MAPRSRARAAQAACSAPAAATAGDLPDAVLVQALGFLNLKERCAQGLRAAKLSRGSIYMAAGPALSGECPAAAPAAPAHCHRRPTLLQAAGRACVQALCGPVLQPELLREVDVGTLMGPPALRSLMAWLLRHGAHVRQLQFYAAPAMEVERSSAAATFMGCLVAAGAAGSLEELKTGGDMPSTEWLAAMRSLRRLLIVGSYAGGRPLPISPGISGLTALESLKLDSAVQPISFDAGARLPASITRLSLSDPGHQMPDQASGGAAKRSRTLQLRPRASLQFVMQRLASAGSSAAAAGVSGAGLLCLLGWQHGPALAPGRQPDPPAH